MLEDKVKVNLRTLREEQGLSQDQMAEELGVVPRVYRQYETGMKLPGLKVMVSMASKFGKSVDDLLR